MFCQKEHSEIILFRHRQDRGYQVKRGGRKRKRETLPDLLEHAAASQSLLELASGVEHALDEGADHCCVSHDHILEAITRDEGDVLAGLELSHLERRKFNSAGWFGIEMSESTVVLK